MINDIVKSEVVKMTRCPDECGKKWKTGRQTKPGWQKQKEKEEKKEKRRLMIEEEKMIARLVEEKENKEEEWFQEGSISI